MTEPSAADLNVLYDASLEFGEHWRRPVAELAAERLPGTTDAYRAVVVPLVEACRSAVESHIEEMYARYGDSWSADAKQQAHDWITTQFPWMSEDNVRHGIAQGVYYAWHG